MVSIDENNRLLRLYLTGVKPNGKDIGIGSYGKVFEVEYCGGIYAAKQIHSILVQGVPHEDFEATKREFFAECIQSSMLNHPNIIQFLGVYNPGGESLLPVLVMERMQESLTSLVERYSNIPLHTKLSILLDVSIGLWYLHSHEMPIVHRDLSPNNILLTDQLVAKISDLGVAKVIQADSKKTRTRAPGTVDFMPPEALSVAPEYGPPLDMFSYGGVILHVMNQEWPTPLHYVVNDPKTRRLVALSEEERRQEHIGKMTGAPVDLVRIVKQCLDNDPSMRPSISNVSERIRNMLGWDNKKPSLMDHSTETTKISAQPKESDIYIFNANVSMKWKKVASLPVYRTAATAVLLLGSVYVGGGNEKRKRSFRLDVYNLSTNQWSFPVTTPYSDFAMTVMNDKLLIVGGLTTSEQPTNKVFVLDGGEWKEYSKMPTARSYATAAAHHSMLIVVGGTCMMNGTWTTLKTVEVLDTTNACWYTCNNLPSPYDQLQGVIIQDMLYLLGGLDRGKSATPDVIAASLNTVSTHQLNWHVISRTPWCSSTPAVLYNKYLLAIGGRNKFTPSNKTHDVCALDVSTGLWRTIGNIPEARSRLAVVGVADNKVICIGGAISVTSNEEVEYSDVVWIGTIN